MNTREIVISRKLSKAKSFLLEIGVLMDNKFYTTVISRLYYSCFHATSALLLTQDIMPKTHKGVSKMLHESFVNTGIFNHDKAIFFDKLMKERIQDDYNDFLILEEDDVVGFIEPARDYVAYIENIITKIQPLVP